MRTVCSHCSKNNKIETGKIISSKHKFVAQCQICKSCWDPASGEAEHEFYLAHKKQGTVFSSLNE